MAHPDSTRNDTDGPDRSGRPADGGESGAPRDPVTGSDDHTTGEAQAAENERTDPVA